MICMERYLDIDYLKSLISKYYPTVTDVDWIGQIVGDFKIEQNQLSLAYNKLTYTYGQMAYLLYRIERYILENRLIGNFDYCSERIKNYIIKEFSSHISPFSKLEKDVYFAGNNIFISGNIHIHSGCVFYSNIEVIGDKTYNNVNKPLYIDKNCTIKNNVKIINSNIDEGVVLESGVVVRENIESFARVGIINQLQITERKSTYIPSQELAIYGLVPKYKNKLTIYGDGIYNPNIVLRFGNKKYNMTEIDYWDKNKIILKIKCDKSTASKLLEEEKIWRDGCFVKLIIMTRGIKTTVNDNRVVIKLLKNI